MKTWFVLLFGLLFVVVSAETTQAHTDSAWTARYYNNLLLSGSPTLTRSESTIVHYWGGGSPDGRISDDRFSARWTRRIDLEAGTYRFTTTADDGVRIYVNGQLILNKWQFQSATHTVDFAVPAGEAAFKVEYFENTGNATMTFGLEKVRDSSGGSGAGGGGAGFEGRWRGEYFNNRYLSGAATLIRASNVIDFDWGTGSPDPVIQADNFSVRWTKSVQVDAGRYRFSTTSDDGVRVFVNGRLLLDKWFDQRATPYSAEIDLASGSAYIEVQYYDNTGNAVMKMNVQRVANAPQSHETVVVDNSSANFTYYGPSNRWFSEQTGYNGSMLWTYTLSNNVNDQNYAYWTPSLAARKYIVQVFIPPHSASTVNAQYWVQHRYGRTMVPVNQSTNAGRWVSLGTFEFAADGRESVSLSSVTYESGTRQIAFDAVRWVPVR